MAIKPVDDKPNLEEGQDSISHPDSDIHHPQRQELIVGSLFEEDVRSSDGCIPRKKGSLDRYDFISEQQKTLNQLQQRSIEGRARNNSGQTPSSPSLIPVMPKDHNIEHQLDPVIKDKESNFSLEKQVLENGEDPLSAFSLKKARSSSFSLDGEDILIEEEENKSSEIVANPFEEESDDVDTRRRSRRLAFSLTILLPENGKLGMSISMIADGCVAVTKLDLAINGDMGFAEAGGLRVHDRLLGANFQPFSGVLSSVVAMLDSAKTSEVLYLQVLRDPAICQDRPPVPIFPVISRLLALTAKYEKKGIATIEESRVMRAAVLGIMARQEEGHRISTAHAPGMGLPFLSPVKSCAEKLCMRAKGLREALCIRCIDTCKDNETVMYLLRIEDVESGTWWATTKRYRNFATLHTELCHLWPPISELPFPVKILASNFQPTVIGERILGLETFLRECISVLTKYACSKLPASLALLAVQKFLEVADHVDEVDEELIHEQMLPPAPQPPKSVELTTFFYLENDMRMREEAGALIRSFHGNAVVERCLGGHELLFKELTLRIDHLRNFFMEYHGASVESTYRCAGEAQHVKASELLATPPNNPEASLDSLVEENRKREIDRAVRRQCEVSIFFPLRRFVFEGIPTLEKQCSALQQRLQALVACGDTVVSGVLQVPIGIPEMAPYEWASAKASLKRLCSHLLPCDMVDSLCVVSQRVVALHGAVTRGSANRILSLACDDTHDGECDGSCDDNSHELVGDAVTADVRHNSLAINDQVVMSADDFLPLLAFVIIHTSPPNLLIVSELCAHLLDPEESIAERGYFVASLQAAVNIALNIQVDGVDLDVHPVRRGSVEGITRTRKRDIFFATASRLSFTSQSSSSSS